MADLEMSDSGIQELIWFETSQTISETFFSCQLKVKKQLFVYFHTTPNKNTNKEKYILPIWHFPQNATKNISDLIKSRGRQCFSSRSLFSFKLINNLQNFNLYYRWLKL